MKCPKCGFEFDETVNFCSNCGENISMKVTSDNNKDVKNMVCDFICKIKNSSKTSLVKCLIVVLTIVLLFGITSSITSSFKKIVVPYSAELCLGKDKDTVFEDFQSEGFSNILIEKKEDLEISEVDKNEIVDYISINDVVDFDEDSKFRRSSQIVIGYHTFKSVSIPFSSEEVKFKNTDEIINTLKNIGFSNILVEEKYDLDPDDTDIEFENQITIDETDDFEVDSSFSINSEIKIIIHRPYNKYSLKVLIDFIPNIMLSKYDVIFKAGGHTEKLIHGADGSFEYRLKEGKYTLAFQSEEYSYIETTVEIELTGDTEASYKINCYNDEINVQTLYIENRGEVGEDEAMVPSSSTDCRFENYKDVTKLFKKAGFTNISTEILYDIIWGWTEEGEVEKVSIDGKTDFQRGEVFPEDADVVITYHMKEEDNPNKKVETTTNKDETTIEKTTAKKEPTKETTTKKSSAVFYSTNDYKTATKGNKGVFSYKNKNGSYDVYWIVDFDDGYVYFFTDGNGGIYCDKLKIVSGNLNNSIIVTWHDGSDQANWYLHFKYVNHPETLVVTDHFDLSTEFTTTDLNKALNIRRNKIIVEN